LNSATPKKVVKERGGTAQKKNTEMTSTNQGGESGNDLRGERPAEEKKITTCVRISHISKLSKRWGQMGDTSLIRNGAGERRKKGHIEPVRMRRSTSTMNSRKVSARVKPSGRKTQHKDPLRKRVLREERNFLKHQTHPKYRTRISLENMGEGGRRSIKREKRRGDHRREGGPKEKELKIHIRFLQREKGGGAKSNAKSHPSQETRWI